MLKQLETKRKQYNKVADRVGHNFYLSDLDSDYKNVIRCENLVNMGFKPTVVSSLFSRLMNGHKIVLGCC